MEPTNPQQDHVGAPRLPRVVVLGAGFGGLEAAKALRGVAVDITIVDRHNHHCFQPLLYQVATAALSPSDVAWPIRHMLAQQDNVTVLMSEVRAIDTKARIVHGEGVSLAYDHLIIATGATYSFFGHDEWASLASGLKRLEDATLIRRRLLIAFERAEIAQDEDERRRLLSFAIVGGGPTGVELAGAIAEVARQTLPPDFRRIDPRAARIILIEAGPRILPALSDDLSRYATDALERMGVEVLVSSPVTNCVEGGVEIGKKFIPAATIIWSAGVVASPAATWIGAAHDRAGRALVGPDLSVPGLPEIFIIGDAAAVTQSSGELVPGLAAAAKQMGHYVAGVIAAKVKGAPLPDPFHYRHQGDLATIGRSAAVVKLRHLRLTGMLGWLFWSFAHIYFLIGLRSRFVVAFSWAWQYLTFQRGARLITDVPDAAYASADPLHVRRAALPRTHVDRHADIAAAADRSENTVPVAQQRPFP